VATTDKERRISLSVPQFAIESYDKVGSMADFEFN